MMRGDKCLSLKMFSGGEEKELLFDNDGGHRQD